MTGGEYKNIGYTRNNTFVDNNLNQNDINYYWVIPANEVGDIYTVGLSRQSVNMCGYNTPSEIRYQSDLSWNNKVADLVNDHRVANGLKPLVHVTDGPMFNGTYVRAEEIRILFSHTRPDGKNCWTAYGESGFQFEGAVAAENIAMAHRSTGGMDAAIRGFDLLKASPEHNKNMLKPDITHMSFGLIYDYLTGFMYVVHFFAKPAR
ncbi:MAG TPA: CAP domain-containing protein [Clostridiaceae bacterium]|nr:CAP domain-containing protein [Clostridiaceae bacterium]